jgi:poly(3-hydroxybutyrate) depolymerase
MNMRHAAARLLAAAFIGLLGTSASGVVINLPKYNVSVNDVSLSGLSSGAYMAVQMHFAYSATVRKGAGVIAGGPPMGWRSPDLPMCRQTARPARHAGCTSPSTAASRTPTASATPFTGMRAITADNLVHVANRRVYIGRDGQVSAVNSNQYLGFYSAFAYTSVRNTSAAYYAYGKCS